MKHPVPTSTWLRPESTPISPAPTKFHRLLGAGTAKLLLAIFVFALPRASEAGQRFVLEESPQQAFSQSLSGDLFNTDIAASPFGRFVVTWSDFSDVFVRVGNPNGSPVGPAFNPSTTTGDATYSRVAMARDGSFVVAWRRISDKAVLARRFDFDGSPIGSPFQVNNLATTGSVDDLDLDMNDDGFFVVTWSSRDALGATTVAARRYDASANALGPQFQANTFTGDAATNIHFFPSVAVRPDNQDFVLSWTPVPGADHDVRARAFEPDGSPATAEFDVNSFTMGEQNTPALRLDPSGLVSFVWTGANSLSNSGLSFRRFLANGTPLFDDSPLFFSGAQSGADITTSNESLTVVAWANNTATRGLESTTIQTYIDGYDFFQMNFPDANPQTEPAVALDDRGVLATAWVANQATGSGDSILVRRILIATVLDQFPVTDNIYGTAIQSSWQYYLMNVPAGTLELKVDLYDLPPAAPNDVDLYVRFGSKPDLATFDCRSFAVGNAAEQCLFTNPPPGEYWIGVNAFNPGSILYTLRAGIEEPTLFADGFESGNTSAWSTTLP